MTVKTIKASQAIDLAVAMIIFAQLSLHRGQMLKQHQENQVPCYYYDTAQEIPRRPCHCCNLVGRDMSVTSF
jgi:hypothetical protein